MKCIKADLHVHTNISDGSFSIKEVIEKALENEVTHLGIVNHDTVKGLEDAIEEGRKNGVKIIPGVEISAYDFENSRKVHILGYNFNTKGRNIESLCRVIRERRNMLSLWQVQILKDNGYDISLKKILYHSRNSEVIYKQFIMQELIDKGYTERIYSDLYYELFKGNGLCNGEIIYVDAYKAVEAIIKDGGIPVLAHPGQLNSYNIIPKLVKSGLKGIELNHNSHTSEDLIKINKLANQYNLLKFGGSDFHGAYGSGDRIGSYVCPIESLGLMEGELKSAK